MRQLALATIIVFAPNVAVGLPATQEKAIPCPGRGLGSEYLVPTAVAAKAIYRAVASAVVPQNLKKFPIVVTKDEGGHWAVGQTDNASPPEPMPSDDKGRETVLITTGGGQFSMDIDKCTGAISNATLAR